MSDAITERLDQLIAIQRLVHREALAEARTDLRGNDVKRALLDLTEDDWIKAGALKNAVVKKTKAANSTVSAHIADLLAAGLLAKRFGGPKTEYRGTGIV
jgi:hypothetical protein